MLSYPFYLFKLFSNFWPFFNLRIAKFLTIKIHYRKRWLLNSIICFRFGCRLLHGRFNLDCTNHLVWGHKFSKLSKLFFLLNICLLHKWIIWESFSAKRYHQNIEFLNWVLDNVLTSFVPLWPCNPIQHQILL